MKRLVLLPLAALLFGCLPETPRKQIIVRSEATLKVVPDSFRLNTELRARGETRDDAIKSISETLDRVTAEFPKLEGLEKSELDPSGVRLNPVYEAQCRRDRYDDDACPVIGYLAEIDIEVEGSPAEVAGNALSLLSDLDVAEVEFNEYFIRDLSKVYDAAQEKAFENAKNKAGRLAEMAGTVLTGVIKIQMKEYEDEEIFYGGLSEDSDVIVVTGSRISPKNELSITPAPMKVQREMTVTFEIE
jgi:uncharacterized protein